MKKSLLNLLGVAALSYSVHAYSAGVGGINVESALGQSLKAEIELFTTDKAEKASIIARLASVEAYRGRGLDYPFSNKFKFAIESHADGSSFIRVSSVQPVNDPYVSLLVDVNWASGKLQREFTFLLDPPGYQPAQALAAPVETVAPALELSAPVVVNTPVAAPAEVATDAGAALHAHVGAQAEPVEVHSLKQASVIDKARPTVDAEGGIKVHRGDSLAKLAEQHALDGVSLERMMIALYRANVKQFDGKNMNRIKTGKILRMPDEQELADITEVAAKQEIHVQVNDWNAYRQQLASAAPKAVTSSAPAVVSSGKISSSVTDKSPLVKDNAKEVLKLSKGLTPTEQVVSTGKGAPSQEQKNALQEDQIAKAKAAEEQRGRAALLEKNLKEIQHLAELKTQAAALLPASSIKPAVVLSAQSSVVAASSVASASAVSSASGVVASSQVNAVSAVLPVVRRKPVVVEPSLIDTLMAEPLYLVGGLAALLGLGGLGFALSRRKANAPKASLATESYDIGSATGRIAVPEISSPDNGDFTKTLVSADNRLNAAKEDDPISEADLFLSFGRDAQAEEILKEALQVTPNNEAIQLKLLEIYAKNQNKASFEKLAKSLQSSVASSAWQHAQSMGKKLDPKNTLYGSVVEDAESATMQTLSLKNGVEATPTLNQKMDFDITGSHNSATNDAEKTMIFSAADMASAQKAVMDFDVTSTHPSPVVNSNMDFDITATHPAEGTPVVVLSDMVFDVTATHPSMLAAPPAALADDGGMAFSLDFPIEAAAPVAKPAEFNLSDISFDLNDKPAATTFTPASDFNEVATKLDLAKAYQEMGDTVGAREILDEVIREGNTAQRDAAQVLINQLV